MAKFVLKEHPVEALTFQEVVDFGISKGAQMVDGLPTDFRFEKGLIVRAQDGSNAFDIYTWHEPFYFSTSDMLVCNGTHLFSMDHKDFAAEYRSLN